MKQINSKDSKIYQYFVEHIIGPLNTPGSVLESSGISISSSHTTQLVNFLPMGTEIHFKTDDNYIETVNGSSSSMDEILRDGGICGNRFEDINDPTLCDYSNKLFLVKTITGNSMLRGRYNHSRLNATNLAMERVRGKMVGNMFNGVVKYYIRYITFEQISNSVLYIPEFNVIIGTNFLEVKNAKFPDKLGTEGDIIRKEANRMFSNNCGLTVYQKNPTQDHVHTRIGDLNITVPVLDINKLKIPVKYEGLVISNRNPTTARLEHKCIPLDKVLITNEFELSRFLNEEKKNKLQLFTNTDLLNRFHDPEIVKEVLRIQETKIQEEQNKVELSKLEKTKDLLESQSKVTAVKTESQIRTSEAKASSEYAKIILGGLSLLGAAFTVYKTISSKSLVSGIIRKLL